MNSFLHSVAIGLPAGSEWIIILLIILLLFGGAKIPALMRGVGKGMGELQKGISEGKKSFNDAMHKEDGDEDLTASAKKTPSSTDNASAH